MKLYENYKDSEIEWIGKIPDNWDLKKIKYCVNKRDELIEDPKFLIAVENIGSGTGKLIGLQIEKNYIGVTNSFKKGDIIFNKLRPYLAKVYKAERDGGCYGELLILNGKSSKIENDFLFYVMFSKPFIDTVDSSTHGTKMPRANWDGFIKQMKISIPPLKEQTQIANYLDHKTQQIDTLIEKKERLIALLEEERTAIINQAVTKGLDPNAKMKDSGIGWLGEIPEHWEVSKIKFVAGLKSGDNIISEQIEQEGLYPVYGGNGIRGYCTAYTNEGDFVLIGRQGALCGNIKYAKDKFWASEHAIVCYLNEDYNWLWFGKLLETMNLNQYSQSAAQPGLAVGQIKNLSIPKPPEHEILKIVEYIKTMEKRIEEMLRVFRNEIYLLKEYKTTLISEVVTGKIDVREEVLN